jgi:hypothetical protein
MARSTRLSRLIADARSFAVGWALTGIGAGVLAAWQILKREGVSLPVAISWGVVVAYAVLGSANHLLGLRERGQRKHRLLIATQKRLQRSSPKGIEDQIWAWAREFNLTPTIAERAKGESFRLLIAQQGCPYAFVSKSEDAPWLYYIGLSTVEPNVKQGLGPALGLFRADLGLEMIRLGIELEYTAINSDPTQPDMLVLRHSDMFGETTDAHRFFGNLWQIYRALNTVSVLIERYGESITLRRIYDANVKASPPASSTTSASGSVMPPSTQGGPSTP